MNGQLAVDADLSLSVELPGQLRVEGSLTGSGSALRLRLSDPSALVGRGALRTARTFAEQLVDVGLTVTVDAPAGPVVTLGAPHCPWWQRGLTGARHIRVEHVTRTMALARGRASATAGALPPPSRLPSGSMRRAAPVLMRRLGYLLGPRRLRLGGRPRLELVDSAGGSRVFALVAEVTSIGSAADCDVRLPGLDAHEADVRRVRRNEYLVVRRGRVGDTQVNGEPVDRALLRTASRLQVGGWTLMFLREEFGGPGRAPSSAIVDDVPSSPQESV